jgi:hypothetical protein
MEQLLILLKEGLASGVVAILRMSLILVPIMIVAEIARDFNILDPISKKIKWILDLLTLPPEAAFPLLVGVCFGLVYGSALIVDFAREGSLKKRDLLLTGIFLCIGHAAIEDTLIFTAFGANPFLILFIRFSLAFLVTRLAAFGLDYFFAAGKEKMLPETEEII